MHNEIILIADDDRLILFSMAKSLRAVGYTVVEANSGEHAIDICRDITPDLAILDMRMKDVSGVDVGKWLNENTQTPFIFLSAYGDSEAVQSATSAGALGYLVKPADVHQILPTIRAALARGEEIRKLRETEQQLTHTLNNSRTLSVAIGILMERQNIGQQEAFETIRHIARNQRRNIQSVSNELINSKSAA